jgi:hypothetical protein
MIPGVSILGPILARTPVDRIDDVVAVMSDIDDALPPTDGVSCFNKLYLAVTLNVRSAETPPGFPDTRFLNALDVTFGNLYFAALRAFDAGSADTPRAWLPLFEARARMTVAPIQFALAGMNAHINRDLPEALVDTFSALGLTPREDGAPHVDYERVNVILAATEKQVKDGYLDPLARRIDAHFDGVDDVVAIWGVGAARDAAWTNGCALWHLRGIPSVARAYLRTLDRSVGFASRGLLIATGTAAPH